MKSYPPAQRKPVSKPAHEEKSWQGKAGAESDYSQHDSMALSPGSIMHLQRTVGNQAVLRMLSQSPQSQTVNRFIQRKFGSPLPDNVDDVYQQLLVFNPTLKRWKVLQAMSSPTVFTTLEAVAKFLNINPPLTTETDTTPTDRGTTPPTDQGTTPPVEEPKPVSKPVFKPRSTPFKPPTTTTSTTPEWLTNRPLRPVTTTTTQPETGGSSTPTSTTPVAPDYNFGTNTLLVTDSMPSIVNSTNIGNNKPVFSNPPDYINITFGGISYRVKPSQDFLNVDKSMVYRDDSSQIRGAEVELMRPPINMAADPDVLVITDGHHRFVWCAFHGLPFQATFKKSRLGTQLWRDIRYKPTPKSLQK